MGQNGREGGDRTGERSEGPGENESARAIWAMRIAGVNVLVSVVLCVWLFASFFVSPEYRLFFWVPFPVMTIWLALHFMVSTDLLVRWPLMFYRGKAGLNAMLTGIILSGVAWMTSGLALIFSAYCLIAH